MSSQFNSIEEENFLEYTILAGIMLLGSALRAFQLGFQCMWTEELYTLNLTRLSHHEIVSQVMAHDFNPPLFYLMAALSKWAFVSDVAIRYPSMLCGVLLIPVMYLIGKQYKDGFTGLFTAGFTAVLYPLIYYSQFGRAYEACVFFFAITFLFYLKLSADWKVEYAMFMGLFGSITILLHLFAVVPIALLLGSMVFSPHWKEATLAGLVTLLGCTPILTMLFAVTQARLPSTGFTYGMSLLTIMYQTPLEFFDFAFPFFIILCLLAWLTSQRQDRLLITISGVTILFGLACSLITPFFPRYYLTVIVFLLPVCAATLVDALSRVKATSIVYKYLPVLFVLGGLLCVQSSDLLYHYFTQQYVC